VSLSDAPRSQRPQGCSHRSGGRGCAAVGRAGRADDDGIIGSGASAHTDAIGAAAGGSRQRASALSAMCSVRALCGLGSVRVDPRRAARRGSTPAELPRAGRSRMTRARASAAVLGWMAAALWVACGRMGLPGSGGALSHAACVYAFHGGFARGENAGPFESPASVLGVLGFSYMLYLMA
jgi:hypothetical protein